MKTYEIKLIKDNDNRTDSDIEKMEEFYNFLQGECPDNLRFSRGNQPKLSHKKAFSIIYYLQEHLAVFPDRIEKCANCNELFDTWSEGLYCETKGKHYCGWCEDIVPPNYDRGKR